MKKPSVNDYVKVTAAMVHSLIGCWYITTGNEENMSFSIVLCALVFLMLVAYRGCSVILMAPTAALGTVFFIEPPTVATVFSDVFLEKMAEFLKLHLRCS